MSAPYSVAARNAVFNAQKAVLMQMVANEGGMFASEIEGKIADSDILKMVDSGLTALAIELKKEAPQGPSTTAAQRT